MIRKLSLESRAESTHWVDQFPSLASNVLEVRSLEHLKKAMGWVHDPLLDAALFQEFRYLEDLNDRPLRDAEVICSACCNNQPEVLLEIGTSLGQTTALMAQNAVKGVVHTVNIPPEEIDKGGQNVTYAPSDEQIGKIYREQGLTNVRQIFANTATWEPDLGLIDVAFIDGCHDARFVFNDTAKILQHCRPGSIILWHDFNPELARVYNWIKEVCQGVECLYKEGLIRGRILHLQDSWIGLYRVPINE